MNLRQKVMDKLTSGQIEIQDLNIHSYKTDYNTEIINYLKQLKEFDYDVYTHSVRVGVLALDISKRIGCDTAIQSEVYLGGLVHDIGKLFIPKSILNKPGPLSRDEFDYMKLHTLIGAGYVINSLPYNIIRIIRDHHEKLDGSGYLLEKDYNDINFQTRIVSIADIIDGYSSKRSYHEEKSHDETMQFLSEENGLDGLIIKELLGNISFDFKKLQYAEI